MHVWEMHSWLAVVKEGCPFGVVVDERSKRRVAAYWFGGKVEKGERVSFGER